MENPKIFINRNMKSNPFYMAPVEIIVPFNGEQAHVAKLMESIFNTIHTNRYLITLVDDGSANKHFIKDIDKKKIPGVRCFRTDENKGFGAAVNLALKTPWKGDAGKKIAWVLIMHSDVFAEDNNWLSNMGKSMYELHDKNVKMISPMTNNPMVDEQCFIGKRGEPREDHILTDGFLPMYCSLANRELFNRIGFFKEYPYAGTEVEEFASRMKMMGYKQAICGSSWINHVGGATLERLSNNQDVQGILRKVREEFQPGPEKEILSE